MSVESPFLNVTFDFEKASLKTESFYILIDVAKLLLSDSNYNVEVQGYCDQIEKDVNQLSLKRAETVKKFLVGYGVSLSRLTTVGLGNGEPIFQEADPDSRSYNRRVEFKIK